MSLAVSPFTRFDSCLLPNLPSGLLEAEVALFVCSTCTESEAHDGRPRPSLEQQD